MADPGFTVGPSRSAGIPTGDRAIHDARTLKGPPCLDCEWPEVDRKRLDSVQFPFLAKAGQRLSNVRMVSALCASVPDRVGILQGSSLDTAKPGGQVWIAYEVSSGKFIVRFAVNGHAEFAQHHC